MLAHECTCWHMNAHVGTWMHMNAHECTWMHMNAHGTSSSEIIAWSFSKARTIHIDTPFLAGWHGRSLCGWRACCGTDVLFDTSQHTRIHQDTPGYIRHHPLYCLKMWSFSCFKCFSPSMPFMHQPLRNRNITRSYRNARMGNFGLNGAMIGILFEESGRLRSSNERTSSKLGANREHCPERYMFRPFQSYFCEFASCWPAVLPTLSASKSRRFKNYASLCMFKGRALSALS